MEDIVIPMEKGNIEDIDEDGDPDQESSSIQNSETTAGTSTEPNSQVIYEVESR